MKRILVPFAVFALLSCDDKPKEFPDEFRVVETLENVKTITYDWSWGSTNYNKKKGYNDNIIASFDIDGYTSGGDATAFGVVNKSGKICDVYTYINGKPDTTHKFHAWVIEYKCVAPVKVKVSWKGQLNVKSASDTTYCVETLFQAYGAWPVYSNNIRPQVEVDTLFLGNFFTEEERSELRKEARARMIARFYCSSVEISVGQSLEMEADGEYELTPGTTYRMQLFTRVISNDDKFNAEYEITDGKLEIEFDDN